MRADSILVPDAALASVLARIILECFTASGGRSENRGAWNNRASRSAGVSLDLRQEQPQCSMPKIRAAKSSPFWSSLSVAMRAIAILLTLLLMWLLRTAEARACG